MLYEVAGIMCDKKEDHKNSCVDCTMGFAIVEEIKNL